MDNILNLRNFISDILNLLYWYSEELTLTALSLMALVILFHLSLLVLKISKDGCDEDECETLGAS